MSNFGGGGDRRALGGSGLAGPVTPTSASKTESEYQNDDAKSGWSAGRRSRQIRMIRCRGVSDPGRLGISQLGGKRALARPPTAGPSKSISWMWFACITSANGLFGDARSQVGSLTRRAQPGRQRCVYSLSYLRFVMYGGDVAQLTHPPPSPTQPRPRQAEVLIRA